MKLQVTLVKSPVSSKPNHIKIVKALGLHKIGDTTEQPDNAATRGKVAQIGYLLQVTEEN